MENTYGVPLLSGATYTKSDWQLFCAAIASANTSSMFITDVVKFTNNSPSDGPQTDLYDTLTADYAAGLTTFEARPVVSHDIFDGIYDPWRLT